jgi:predicted ATP-grasp superfamily ATP-dependent carboligase
MTWLSLSHQKRAIFSSDSLRLASPNIRIFSPAPRRNTLKRPVLIVGWIPRIVVGIARSLAAAGVSVDVADFTSAPRLVSRSIRQFRRLPSPDADPDGFLRQLRAFISAGDYDMLIPADDQALVAITNHYHELHSLLYLACPPPEITRRVLNKLETLDVARKCGILVPDTKVISNSEQLADLGDKTGFPCVLKPGAKEARNEEVKSYILRSARDASVKFPEPRVFHPPMLLQAYCDGDGVGVEILIHRGQTVAAFQHRRLKECPYTGGLSVTAVSEPLDPELAERSVSLLRALQWEGPAMVEFKVDQKNRRAVLMEVNGRYWGTISLPRFAGIDFPNLHWQIAHGEQPTAPPNYAVGVQWRWTAGHLLRTHGVVLAARRSISARGELLHNISELPGLFNPSTRDALLRLSDPLPALLELFRTLKFLVFDDVRTLVRRFRSNELDSNRSFLS